MHNLYLSLGSNLGKRHETIRRALDLLDERIGSVYLVSEMIETEPWGFESKNPFINCACLVHTMMSPRRCLEETQKIERELGRTEKGGTEYKDRIIDIDMLMYDDIVVDEPDLKLPHPHMYERDFVMIPLKQIMN